MRILEKELAIYRKLKSKKGRREYNKFLVEGVRCIQELLKSDYTVEKIIVCEKYLTETGRLFVAGLQNRELYYLEPKKFDRIIGEKTSQGVIALAEIKHLPSMKFRRRMFVVVAHKISDPSNMGSLIRSSAAFGAKMIVGSESVDIYSPKVISASSGYLFNLEIEICPTVLDRLNHLRENTFAIWGGDNRGKDVSTIKRMPNKVALVVGNEAFGISNDVRQKLDDVIRIPIDKKVESLSAPVAGGILMYSISRAMHLIN
jgi:RNA methyltransferase, TrmH family